MNRLPQGLIDDRYQILGELGRGGVGTVYRAREAATGRDVALKLLPGRVDGRRRERFRREGAAAAALVHPGIVRVHAAGEWGGRPYLVYELVDGARTLDEVLYGLILEERLELVRQAAEALGHAHAQGVVHRDVKPGNVLVDLNGRARVTDFGLAVTTSDDRLTRTGELVGTPSYMAPEQLSGQVGGETPATDVWALGVILYEALTEELPFEGANFVQLAGSIAEGSPVPPSHVRESLDPGLEAICLRALRPEPARRYPDAQAFAEALADPASQRPRRSPLLAFLLVACVAALLGAGLALRDAQAEAPEEDAAAVSSQAPVEPEAPTRGPGLERIKEIASDRKRLEALDRWLTETGADDPRREEARRLQKDLAWDLPLARLEGLPSMLGAAFLDDDTLCVLSPRPALLRLEGGELVRQARVTTKDPKREQVELLIRPGSELCDVLMHVPNEPGRVFRNRTIEEVFSGDPKVFAFDDRRDVGLTMPTKRRGTATNQPLPAIVGSVDDERGLFATIREDQGNTEVQLVRHVPGEPPEVWSQLYRGKAVSSIALSSRGTYLGVAVEDPVELFLFETASGKELWSTKLGSSLDCMAFSPDERWLAVGCSAELIFLLEVPGDGTHRILQRARKSAAEIVSNRSHAATVRGLVFSRDSKTLISCSARNTNRADENELRVWDVVSGEDQDRWYRNRLPLGPYWLAISPSGKRLALGGRQEWLEVRRLTPIESE